ncbi:MAG: hypothetical protein Kow0065_04030 [Methylomicrobium sp.]
MIRLILLAAFCAFYAHCTYAQKAPVYTLSVEWPADADYRVDVYDQYQSHAGITITPTLQFHGKNRQTVLIVPETAICSNPQRKLYLSIQALRPSPEATVFITDDQQVLYRQAIIESVVTELPELDVACQPPNETIIGELTIAVAKPAADATLSLASLLREDVGHAWIVFRAVSPQAPLAYATAGTYSSIVGNNVFNGINFFREIYRPADAYKTVSIDRDQWSRLVALIEDYVELGTASWTPWHNCTQFAIDAWHAVTGETLSATQPFPGATWEVTELNFPNTVSLYHSILEHGGHTTLPP